MDPQSGNKPGNWLTRYLGVFRYSRRAIALVWTTNRRLTLSLITLSILGGVAPALIAYVGKLIVDSVVYAAQNRAGESEVIQWVIVELALVAAMALLQRGLNISRSLLRAELGNRVNVMILRKALTLSLTQFENADFYDKMTRARREASSRPLGLVSKTFGLIQDGISLVSFSTLLLQFSPLAAAALVITALPVFFAETHFSGEAFRIFRWRTPEMRQQYYLEAVVAREDHAKEVKLFELGPRLIDRYDQIFHKLYAKDKNLTWRSNIWGFLLGLVSTGAFYGVYVWTALSAARGYISLGEMTMYVMLFKQGQSAFSSQLSAIRGMYEDNLYLSNLYEFLDAPVEHHAGQLTAGVTPQDGIRFENVSFVYPGSETPALSDIDLHIPPGSKLALVGENGSGKTTLIKLLTRLYEPTTGRILLDGTDLQDWEEHALRRRIGVIFQDFARYQFTVGENIGAGNNEEFEDREQWQAAADKGLAAPFIDDLPSGYDTQLGRWFKDGRELSLGQWQKIALARAFIRNTADVLVLDEPTSSMDAEAEVKIFDRFRELTVNQIAILISHRFSTVRMAENIVVLRNGRIVESGDHASLLSNQGIYARLFELQAEGYR